jgi:Nif-specific regulatory protein
MPFNLTMPVVIEGETGVGKTLIAHTIHSFSEFSATPLITVMCGTSTEDTVINSLLQHDHMIAETNTDKEATKGGERAILFEELGDLSDSVQVQIAKYLEASAQSLHRKEVKPSLRAKFIFTTTMRFSDLLDKDRVRPDLFYRLGSFTLSIPSLRQREGDILDLSEYFLRYYAELQKRAIPRLSNRVIEHLIQFDWPGNVRQLENIMEFAVITDKDGVIGIDDLPKHFDVTSRSLTSDRNEKGLKKLVEEYENKVIQDALKMARGNIRATADYLKTTERIIGYKVKKYGIESRSFK